MPNVLGIDAGGTSSRAMALDSAGQVLWRSDSGAANLASTPAEVLGLNLRRLLEGCPPVEAAVGCFAGALTRPDFDRGESLMRGMLPSARVRVLPDYAAAVRVAQPRYAAVAILGTGSIVASACGREFVRSGGNGFMLGDEASGYRLGVILLRTWLREPSLVNPAGKRAIRSVFGSLDRAEVVAQCYRPAPAVSQIASLAGATLSAWLRRDEEVAPLVDAELDAFAATVLCHTRRYVPVRPTLRIAALGGLWKTCPRLMDAVGRRIQAQLPEQCVSLARLRVEPVRGAALLAMDESRR